MSPKVMKSQATFHLPVLSIGVLETLKTFYLFDLAGVEKPIKYAKVINVYLQD